MTGNNIFNAEPCYLVLRYFEPLLEITAKMEEAFIKVKDATGLLFAYSATDSADYLDIHIFPDYKEEKAVIRLFIDPLISTAYLLIEDADKNRREIIIDIIQNFIEFISPPELKKVALQTMKPNDILRASIAGSDTLDPVLLDILRAGFGNMDDHVRKAAALGSRMLLWPELLPYLENAYSNETSEDVIQELKWAISTIKNIEV